MRVHDLTLWFALIIFVLISLDNEVLTKKSTSIKLGKDKKQSKQKTSLFHKNKQHNINKNNNKQQDQSLKHSYKLVQHISPFLQSKFCRKHPQVIGGNVEGSSFPHVAVLYERIKSTGRLTTYCGGSIISKFHILTTAHCLIMSKNVSRKIKPSNIVVRVGMHDLGLPEFNSTGHRTTLKVKKVVIHDHYDALTRDNDIALIKLKLPITFTSNIRPLCINGLHFHYNFSAVPDGVVAGWGDIAENGSVSNVLKYAKLYISNFSNCWDYGNYVNKSVKVMYFCANYDDYQDGHVCSGDSGSGMLPLDAKHNPQNLIVGILSGGGHYSSNGVPLCGNPMFFVNVTTYALWINKAVDK